MTTTTLSPGIIRRRARPVVSDAIAVLTYNQPKLVEAMYDIMGSYLIVVDNGSPESIPHTSIRVPSNRYFAGGWNYAMERIDAEWVAMLNDDITGITREMIDHLIAQAERHGYDAISPAFNSPHKWSQPLGEGLRPVPAIDWVATIVRKEAWEAVKGFNASAFPGYGSDLDIAYRLKQAGYLLAVDDGCIIHHMGGTAALEGGTQHIQGNLTAMNASFQKLYGMADWSEFTRTYLLKEV